MGRWTYEDFEEVSWVDRRRRAVERHAWVSQSRETDRMKLGLSLGYSGARLRIPIERIQLAERLGYDSVWTAEAYGSDAITPLAWIAAQTERIRLGTGIMQLAGRSPAMAAMQAQTVDALAGGGRVIAGLGVSGPQIVEGWYGEPWGNPYWRLRDYIQIMRKVNHREEPVSHAGREYRLPYVGEGSTGLGKPLMSIMHTTRDLPIWMGSGSEATVKLTAELCDGWLPMHFVPGRMDHFRPWIEEGFRRAGGGKSWDDFEIQGRGAVVITDDVGSALAEAKPSIALYAGGMGHKTVNFHNQHMRLRGYPEVADRVQELYLAGRKQEAIDAIPDEYVDEAGLYGSIKRIEQRWPAWADSGLTGFTVVTNQEEAIQLMADLTGLTSAPGRPKLGGSRPELP
jgi:F420-dependent oxidoreductase-like protein